ncbi:MAG: PDZ domain-containing protein [Longimicrobiales bacterium]|nr:PDZ domain-containing protein [Longimicrobiales bacterium]
MFALRRLAAAIALVVLTSIASTLPAAAQEGTRLLRDPAVGPDRIAFVHANDIWTVGRDGGRAVRLTTDEGAETNPAFSPDGRWIAFSGQYAGNTDVYVVPAEGGQPARLTWHPAADVVQGWTPEGEVLFRSGREGQPTRTTKFFTVSVEGGLPTPLALPRAYDGVMSEDGAVAAYQEVGFWDPGWRNYRGGQAQPISVVDLADYSRRFTPWEGERQMAPAMMEGVVYYISERDWAGNVWSWDPATGEERQLTTHVDFDVMSLDAGWGAVVYEQGGYLHELDPQTGATRQLVVEVAGDQKWARTRWEEVRPGQLRDPRLSPTGQRALFEYRGDLYTVPREAGSWRNITRSPGVADRHAVWSPDGSRIAWFNDEEGEYGVVIADQDGANPRRIEIPDPTFFFRPTWSPDGSKLAFTDTDYRALVLDLETEELTHVDTDRFAHPERSLNPVWSPDSRWITWARRLDSHLRAIFVHDTRTGETTQLTDGMADAIDPVFDASGDYLYFLASTDYGLNTGWLDMTSYDRPVTRALYVTLLAEGTPSPFLPKSDEEPVGEDDTPEDEAEAAGDGEGREADEVVIDFDGIASRILGAPGLGVRDFTGLVAGPEGRVFVTEAVPAGGTVLHRYSIDDAEAIEFAAEINGAWASEDRGSLLLRDGGQWSIVDAAGAPPKAGDGRLAFAALRHEVDPRAEWRQMLRDGWRFMRDFLYVDNQHGAPWDDVWGWYESWLDDVNHRSDFTHLLDMLSAEIAVGHSYVGGGDFPDLDGPGVGLLGVDLEEAEGGYRIATIYTGESWNPDLRGPLAHPGMGVEEGDFLVAVDGRPLAPPTNPFALLEGTSGRTIRVSVNDTPSLEGAREIVVEPVGDDRQLRQWAWVAENQRRVDELSGGRLAYVWVPNTGQGGYTAFNRMYFAQQDRLGAVIDERNNGGGSAADYIVDVLDRELFGYFNSRAGDRKPFTQPIAGLWGPKVMVINERAGSGGDLLPYLFRFRGVGPLVGTRTWGGLVGTWDTPPLLDGGTFVAPRGGFFDVEGEWAVEAEGVAPDIMVRNDPADVIAGRDPQLERAVEEALRLLETRVAPLQTEPAPPIRWRRPGGGD